MLTSLQKPYVRISPCFLPTAFYSALDYRWERATVFHGESHPYYELVYVARGTAQVTEEERVYTLTDGMLILHAPMEFHRIRTEAAAHIFVLCFSADTEPPAPLTDGVFVLTEAMRDELPRLFAQIRRFYYTVRPTGVAQDACGDFPDVAPPEDVLPTPYFGEECALALASFLTALCGRVRVGDTQGLTADAKEYRAIAAYMRERADEPLSLEDIAGEFHTSVSRIKKLFARHAGMGAKQYYLRLRLERCYEHLQNPMLTEREIAERMQFSSAAYFSLFFKSKTGMTPSEYRATRLSD